MGLHFTDVVDDGGHVLGVIHRGSQVEVSHYHLSFKDVRQGKIAEEPDRIVNIEESVETFGVGGEVVVRKHDSLWRAGGARGVYDSGQIVAVNSGFSLLK